MRKIGTNPPCAVCKTPSVAKGLCDKHYRRLAKHGHVEATLRPSDWGRRHKHPLYESWRWMRRSLEGHSPEWLDFWAFVADVGERPSDRHFLRRLDGKKPFSVTNCYWAESLSDKDVLAGRTRCQKRYAAANPLKMKNIYLKKRFGITISDYDQMMAEQNSVCAICGGVDEQRALAVDHCHTTKAVRGLLCTNCNRGLGHFSDDPKILETAIAYLQKSKLRRVA